MKTPYKLDQAMLNDRFEYKDGCLYYRNSYGQRARKGSRAGYLDGGYRKVRFNGINHGEHRVIWVMHFGDTGSILDHIDGNPSNNRIENLREVTSLGNAQNAKTRKDNTSGHRNVYWNKKKRYWEVRVNLKGKQMYVGSFGKDLELASLVAEEARHRYHGQYASKR